MAQISIQEKFCPTCKTSKPVSAFWKDRCAWDGLCYQCGDCKRVAQRLRKGLPPVACIPAFVPLPEEEWVSVVGYEGIYSISNKGRVRRDKPEHNTHPGKLIKPGWAGRYRVVGLTHNGTRKQFTIHRLVAAAFIGPRPPNKHINHKDGCKTNNHVENLEYVTQKENQEHAVKLGLYLTGAAHPYVINPSRAARGERNGNAKLTELQVRTIKRMFSVLKENDIARMFNVNPTTIHSIRLNATWKHVK